MPKYKLTTFILGLTLILTSLVITPTVTSAETEDTKLGALATQLQSIRNLISSLGGSLRGTQAAVVTSSQEDDHAYFDMLTSRPEHVFDMVLRTEGEIRQYDFVTSATAATSEWLEYRPRYDVLEDATLWPFPDGSGSLFHGQLRISEGMKRGVEGFGTISTGKVLYTWETKWSEGWGDYSNHVNQGEHKAFQLARNGAGVDQRYQIDVRYGNAPGSGGAAQLPLSEPQVGHVTLRTTLLGGINPPCIPASDPCQEAQQGIYEHPMLHNYIIYPERWNRFWVEVDFDDDTFSMWAADPVQGSQQLFNRYQFDSTGDGLNDFWWEFNSSLARSEGPDLPIWGRNLAILHNADAEALVSAWAGFQDGTSFVGTAPVLFDIRVSAVDANPTLPGYQVYKDNPLVFASNIQDDDGDDIFTYHWYASDGTTEVLLNPTMDTFGPFKSQFQARGMSRRISHTFETLGTHVIRFNVSDGSHEVEKTVEVEVIERTEPLPGHDYFDQLSAQTEGEVIISKSYRSQAEIDADLAANGAPERTTTVYDAVTDAARFIFRPGLSSIDQGDLIISRFDPIESGNMLVVWDAKWDQGFVGVSPEYGLHTHKSFQLAAGGSAVIPQRLEFRNRFGSAESGNVAGTDVRRYYWLADGAQQPLPNQITDFQVLPETWTRYWAYVDFDTAQFSLWVGDETRTPVQLFNQFQFSDITDLEVPVGVTKAYLNGINQFWFEFNSSQGARPGGPELSAWGRNVVVLHNAADDITDVQAIVNQGSMVPVDNQPPVANSVNRTINQYGSAKNLLNATDINSDALTYEIVTAPTNGSLFEGGTVIGVGDNPTNPAEVEYVPRYGHTGPVTFTFKANDGTEDSNVATVTINVKTGVNTKVTNVSTNEGEAITFTIDVSGAASDGIQYELTSVPINGLLTSTETGFKGTSERFEQDPRRYDFDSPTLTYTPEPGFAGKDRFNFVAYDDAGKLYDATVFIDIEATLITPYNYYNYLASQPSLYFAKGYRNATEISSDVVSPTHPDLRTAYDPVKDATKFTFHENLGSIYILDQIRSKFPLVDSGKILYSWETQWETGFETAASEGTLSQTKTFQLGRNSPLIDQRIQTNIVYNNPRIPGEVGKIEHPIFGFVSEDPRWVNNGIIRPNENDADYRLKSNMWTRFWSEVDFDSKTWSFWAADEVTTPIKVVDAFPLSSLVPIVPLSSGLTEFWYEFNSSGTRVGPDLNAWGRNVVVLHNYADAQALVNVWSRGESPNPPPPPTTPTPSLDSDQDGVPNTLDRCPDTLLKYKDLVNLRGCPVPRALTFDIKPDLNSLEALRQARNLELGITEYGKVTFTNKQIALITNSGDEVNLDRDIKISRHQISINTTNLPDFNQPATITFYNVTVKTPVIKRDGVVCTTCTIQSFSNGTLVVNVTGFSTYTVEEVALGETPTPPTPATPTDTVTPRSSGGGGGGGGSRKSTETTPLPTPPIVTPTTPSPLPIVTPTFTYRFTLTDWSLLGYEHEGVRQLQKALNHLGFTIATTGSGSPNNETTYFGPATEAALKRFQTTHNIVTSGSPDTTGYGALGPSTRDKLNQLLAASPAPTSDADRQALIQSLLQMIEVLMEKLRALG